MIEQADKLNNQAIILASDGSYKEAIACFKRALTLQQDNDLLWYNLGVTYRDGGELDKAYDALKMAYTMNPENEDSVEAFATLCLAQKKMDECRYISSLYLKQKPFASHFWNLLGVCEFQSEDYTTAAEFFEQAIYINPYYLDALYNLRDTYSMLNMPEGEDEMQRRIKDLEK